MLVLANAVSALYSTGHALFCLCFSLTEWVLFLVFVGNLKWMFNKLYFFPLSLHAASYAVGLLET